ncbi:chaperone modulator CbpM [Parapedobacter lycopersici]|uniref:chaperone modulator CbpM n=1 Tax=Parapedobacter lycopersici TaxID=1864939 RepID=UPI0033409543
MEKQELIAVHEFCVHHHAEITFIRALGESGLIEVVTVDNEYYVSPDQLPDLERWVRFHYDLDINLEGIEAIQHLLQQMKTMQDELKALKSRLHLYELR